MVKIKNFIAVLTLFLFSSSVAWAAAPMTMEDLAKSNDELRKVVSNLTNKVDDLEGRLAKAERTPSVSVAGSPVTGEGTDGVLRTKGGDIHMDGFIDSSFNWNFATPGATAGGNNAVGNSTLRAFDQPSDTFDVNNIQLNMYRPAAETGGVGFRTEFMYGTDAQNVESGGFLGGTDEFSIQEAYAEIKVPIGTGLTVWIGKFSTLIGAEVIENHLNWNSSRGLLFWLAEPATHTGARAMYSWFDGKVTTALGVVNGWDLAIDNNKVKDIEAQVKWIPTENFNIAQNFIGGSQISDDRADDRYLFDTVATWVPLPQDLPKLSLMGSYDFGNEQRLGAAERGPADWQGYAVYARYAYNDWLTFGTRWEQFWDDEGARTGSAVINDLWEMTYTADIKVYQNLLTRLEYRRDQAKSATAFDTGSANSQDTVQASFIYLFG